MSERAELVDNQEPKRVFVYGTLSRRANPRAHRWGGTVVGLATYPGIMYSHGSFPAVVPHPDGNIVGEVITYEDWNDAEWLDALHHIDTYEGVPHLYRRELVHVSLNDQDISAWMYLYQDEEAVKDMPIIPSGDWATYTERAKRGMVYL